MPDRDSATGRFLAAGNEAARFWAQVEKTEDCWNWTGGLTGKGYGAFYPNDRQVGAHVWAWRQENGPIPRGLVVDHRCENRRCVRSSHLRLLSRGGNVLASAKTRAGRNMRKTECDQGHPLSGDNLIIKANYRNPSRPPWRECRTCSNERKRRRREQRAA